MTFEEYVADRKKCPKCQSHLTQRIFYGLPCFGELSSPDPDPEVLAVFAAERLGFVKFGGCVIGDDFPRRECRTCGHRWERHDGQPGNIFDLAAAEAALYENPGQLKRIMEEHGSVTWFEAIEIDQKRLRENPDAATTDSSN